MPFGFWSVWDAGDLDDIQRIMTESSLPFGFWSVWDGVDRATRCGAGRRVFIAFRLLVCLGPDAKGKKHVQINLVFIAFRLLVCLGHHNPPRHQRPVAGVFIAFRLLVCLGPYWHVPLRHVEFLGLHCLSAFGLFGTFSQLADTDAGLIRLHCLSAFGLFGTNLSDKNPAMFGEGLHCLSAFGLFGTIKRAVNLSNSIPVFIAFRLLVCLGPGEPQVLTKWTEEVFIAFRLLVCLGRHNDGEGHMVSLCLHCLSAFGLFGTCEPCERVWSGSTSLHCLSAFGLFGTRLMPPQSGWWSGVFIAFRLLVCLGPGRISCRLPGGLRLHCLSAFGLFGT